MGGPLFLYKALGRFGRLMKVLLQYICIAGKARTSRRINRVVPLPSLTASLFLF